MKSFWSGFSLGVITVGLFPCWVLAAVLWWSRTKEEWEWVSPWDYASKAAEIQDRWLLGIAIVCWVLIYTLIFLLR